MGLLAKLLKCFLYWLVNIVTKPKGRLHFLHEAHHDDDAIHGMHGECSICKKIRTLQFFLEMEMSHFTHNVLLQVNDTRIVCNKEKRAFSLKFLSDKMKRRTRCSKNFCTALASCAAVCCNRSCLWVDGWVCVWVGGSVTTITRNCVHRSSSNWVCM